MSNNDAKLAGRFGARYGRTPRRRLAEIESNMRRRHLCQKCGSNSVKRVSVGVWKCRKCGFTFSGAAYSPTSKIGDVARRTARGESA